MLHAPSVTVADHKESPIRRIKHDSTENACTNPCLCPIVRPAHRNGKQGGKEARVKKQNKEGARWCVYVCVCARKGGRQGRKERPCSAN